MSNDKKVLTDNPIVDELIYNGQKLMKGCILKDQDEADKYETLESIKTSDMYILIKENRVGFHSFQYDSELLSELGVFTESQIEYYTSHNSSIPNEYRPQLLTLARERYINNYVELNDYYRTIAGMPPLDPNTHQELELFINKDDLDGRNGRVWLQVKSQAHLGIDKWDEEYIQVLEKYGYMDKIKEKYPQLEYLNHLGSNRVNIYTARKAQKFECIYLPDCNSSDIQLHFFELLEKNRNVYLRTLYTEAYKFDSEYYDKFIIIMIILQTFCDMIDEYAYYIIRRDIFDIRTIKYLFEANGVKFFEDIPFKYQLSLVRNLNRLVKYKSTDRNIIDICSLFGFKSIQLFKFYILKDRKMTNGDYNYIKHISETWYTSSLPESKKCSDMVYGNGKYIITLYGTEKFLYSADLKGWKEGSFPIITPKNSANKIMYINGLFLVLSGDYILYSDNITYWSKFYIKSVDKNNTYTNLIYAEGLYILISSNTVMYSTDLQTWNKCSTKEAVVTTREVSNNPGDRQSYEYDRYENYCMIKITYTYNATKNNYIETTTRTYDLKCLVLSLIHDKNRFLALTNQGILHSDTGKANWDISYFDTMKFNDGVVPDFSNITLNDNRNNKTKYFVYANKTYFFINKYSIYSSKDLSNWTRFSINGNTSNFKEIKYANKRLITYTEDNKLYMIPIDNDGNISNDWTVTELSGDNYSAVGYGKFKFVVIPYNDTTLYYYDCNAETGDNDNDQEVTYNNEGNYNLKFIRVPLEKNVLDELSKNGSIYSYYSIIDEDKYWEGDKDRNTVKKEILNHDFNILRTKYYSLDNIVEFSEITFQLSYFLNIITNYNLTSLLTLPLPFIPGGTAYPIGDVFVFLHALGAVYYGIKDDIVINTSEVLTIRSFNFEADLNALASSLYNDHIDVHYELKEMCGGLDFKIPKTNILTYKELMYIYNNNKKIYEYVTNKMIHCADKRLYDIYKKIYDALFVAKLNTENFSVLDKDGNIIYTYPTYGEYLKAKQFSMYSYIQELKAITNEKERQMAVSNAMNDVVSYIQDMTPILDEGELEHIWHGLPTLDMDFIKHYITEVIMFFKSFKAELLSMSTAYRMCDKFDNSIWLIDTMHIDHTFDWSQFFKIYEAIDMNVDMTPKEKIGIKEYIFKVVYSLIDKDLIDDFRFKELYDMKSIFNKSDHIEIIDDLVKYITHEFQDDIYWYEKLFRTYLYTRKDNIKISDGMSMRSYWFSEEDHTMKYSDSQYYSDSKTYI